MFEMSCLSFMSGSNRFRDPLKLALRGSRGSFREDVVPAENGMLYTVQNPGAQSKALAAARGEQQMRCGFAFAGILFLRVRWRSRTRAPEVRLALVSFCITVSDV